MKLILKLIMLLLVTANSIHAQEGIPTNITKFATINFPTESKVIETQRETVYTAEDEFGYYIASTVKFTNQQSSQITKESLQTLYQGVAQGAIDAANAEVVSMDEVFIQDIPALEMEYNAPSNSGMPSKRFKKIIYVDQHIITLDFWPVTSQKNLVNENKTKFFNSFSVNAVETEQPSTVQNNQENTTDIAYETGFLIGKISFFVVLLVLLAGVILLVRYFIRKNKKKKTQIHPIKKPREQITEIICQKCDSKNNSNARYCSTCGYELKKK
ncbi:MAG: hypothetical protein CMC70_09035 [Flavobacteriaceae bacterium]|nr:hypothetical protein [Flavobacteriaceae bacterium]